MFHKEPYYIIILMLYFTQYILELVNLVFIIKLDKLEVFKKEILELNILEPSKKLNKKIDKIKFLDKKNKKIFFK
jgi:hypothetical protein